MAKKDEIEEIEEVEPAKVFELSRVGGAIRLTFANNPIFTDLSSDDAKDLAKELVKAAK